MAYDLNRFSKKPRHKWFSASDRRADEGWYGPHNTIESALLEFASEYGHDVPCFVAQGYKLTKAELEDLGVDYEWEVSASDAIEIRLPSE